MGTRYGQVKHTNRTTSKANPSSKSRAYIHNTQTACGERQLLAILTYPQAINLVQQPRSVYCLPSTQTSSPAKHAHATHSLMPLPTVPLALVSDQFFSPNRKSPNYLALFFPTGSQVGTVSYTGSPCIYNHINPRPAGNIFQTQFSRQLRYW